MCRADIFNREDDHVFTWKKTCAAAFAGAVGVGMTLAGAGAASATTVIDFPDLPGGAITGTNVLTGGTDATVTVDSVDLETGAVSGTFENTGDDTLNCNMQSPSGLGSPASDIEGVVTTSDLVAQTIDYYATHITTPGDGGGLLPTGLLSDSLTGVMGSLGMSQNPLPDLAQQARADGQLGTIDVFTVAPGDTHTWSATLTPRIPDNAPREDFDAAAAFLCQDSTTQNVYLYTGDENGEVPTGGGGATGSLASLTGSLGSSDS